MKAARALPSSMRVRVSGMCAHPNRQSTYGDHDEPASAGTFNSTTQRHRMRDRPPHANPRLCETRIQGISSRIRIPFGGVKVRAGLSIWGFLGFALTASCARTKPPEAVTPTPTSTSKPEPTVAQIVTSFVVQKCPDSPKMNSRKAETALRQMLSPCDHVPGGSVHFAATLMPGGRIELASAPGAPTEGVVPICVLKHTLTHPVSLERPCTFDVRLEASRRAPPPGDAGPSATD